MTRTRVNRIRRKYNAMRRVNRGWTTIRWDTALDFLSGFPSHWNWRVEDIDFDLRAIHRGLK